MPDGNSRSTLTAPDTAAAGTGVDWERRAHRLEALCGFAAEAAGVVDADEIWRLIEWIVVLK